jgi:GH24 family phage-related lysozyme (muramidase)
MITKYTGPGGAVAIPASIGGKAVIGIDGRAFYDNESITSVTIPAGVTSIGWGAFEYCKSLVSVTIPASVTTIDARTFWGCDSLKTISVSPDNRQYQVRDGVLFSKDGKTLHVYPASKGGSAYTITAGVTTIGDGAFYGSASLVSVTMPASVTSIGVQAFINCKSLASITIPAGVTTIPYGAFYECASLKPEVRADIEKRFGKTVFLSPWG